MCSSLPLSIRTVLVLALLPPAAFAASGLGEIDRDEQERLSRACLVARHLDGAAAYRRCVTRAVERLDGRAPVTTLPFEERVIIQRRCGGSESESETESGAACVRDELDALDETRQPFLGSLDADERRALVQRCIDTPRDEGIAGYRRCLDNGLDALDDLPTADLSSLALEERVALARRCDAGTGGASDYRRCLLEATGVPFEAAAPPRTSRPGTAPADAVVPDAPVAAPADTGGVDGEAGIDAATFESREPENAAEPGGGGAEEGAQSEELVTDLELLAVDVRARLEKSVAALDDTYRLLLLAAFALPFLLLIARTAMRGGERARRSAAPAAAPPTPTPPAASGATLAERVSPSPREREPLVALRAFDEDRRGPSGKRASDESPVPGRFVPRSRFGRWLLEASPDLRRQHAIEFLVYWMAYGDERYDVGARRALLERDDVEALDPHERIKRHVLERDTAAFADTLLSLQRDTGAVERVQVLDLLMALLVADRAMTPVQNTLLRFVADAFGIPAETLNERHEFAFDAPLPPLPRPDLPAWWEGVEPGLPIRWNARALAALDEREQHRVRLGLPLDRKIADRRVVESFRRAARRCRPGRFDALGERERALVERQLARYDEARSALLGEAVT